MSVVLYTIGYERRSCDEMLAELTRAHVDRLVDVRELPLSRRPGFSKTSLREALAEVGIEYIHMKLLGNPKQNRARYRSGDVVGGAAAYRRILRNGARSALLELASGLEAARTCLLCFEHDQAACHRAVIVDALSGLRPNLAVAHL